MTPDEALKALVAKYDGPRPGGSDYSAVGAWIYGTYRECQAVLAATPAAREEMSALRDRLAARAAGGEDSQLLAIDVKVMDEILDQSARSVEFFTMLDAKHPSMAKRHFAMYMEILAAHQEFELASRYLWAPLDEIRSLADKAQVPDQAEVDNIMGQTLGERVAQIKSRMMDGARARAAIILAILRGAGRKAEAQATEKLARDLLS